MRILITGATGFLGNNVTRMLLDEGHEITAAVRHSSDPRPLSGLAIEKLNLDLTDSHAVSLAVNSVDLVIHSAALIHIGWTHQESSHQTNVVSTELIAAAARRSSIRLIHVSTVDTLAAAVSLQAAVDETQTEPAKPACAYVVSKRAAEQAVIAEIGRGLDAVIVHPGFMVGPNDWKPSSGKMMLMLAKQPILWFAPAGGCSVVDVRDVAAGIVSAIENGGSGKHYILGGQNMSYLELWGRMATVMKRRPPTRPMSNRLAGWIGHVGDLSARVFKHELEINSASTEIGQLLHYYSSQKAETELGYRIGNVDDALRDAWDWFQKFEYS